MKIYMTMQSRLNKDTVQLLKIADRVEFVRKQYDSSHQKVIALIYLSQDAHPISAMAGDCTTWDAHDIEKSKRSIRRHNKTCLLIDRRDTVLTASN